MEVVISGSGVYTPSDVITNEELVEAFNQYVDCYNKQHHSEIELGSLEALNYSNCEFIEKASGILSRHVVEKVGILNPKIMHPILEDRGDDALSLQAEIAVDAAKKAMLQAGKQAQDIDAVICACSNLQRSYPAMAIEVQQALAINGFAYDMNVACSSATFGIANAKALVDANMAKAVLIVTPEICSAHLNFKDRDSHFIFGDVATAVIVEKVESVNVDNVFAIKDVELFTQFSSNVRNNGGFMNRLSPDTQFNDDKLFYQNGRKVFKEVTLQVVNLINQQLTKLSLSIEEFKCLWLHQANIHMNRLIVEKLLNKELDNSLSPIILDRYANTAGAGSIIAFNQHQQAMEQGDLGLLTSFGAGYSIGSIVLQRL